MRPLRFRGEAVVDEIPGDGRIGFRCFPLQPGAWLYRSPDHHQWGWGWGSRQAGEGNRIDARQYIKERATAYSLS